MSEAALAAAIAKLESVTARLEKVAIGGAPSAAPSASASAPAGQASAAFVEEFSEFVSGPVANFVASTAKLNAPEVTVSVGNVQKAFQAQLAFLQVASQSKKPTQDGLGKLLADTSAAIGQIQSDREANRKSKFFNHLSALSEGIPALGWVAVDAKPAPFVKEMSDAATFYTNRIIKDYKESDASHVEWAKSFIALLTELHDYVKRSHTTGVSWNPKGGDASAATVSAPAPAAAKAVEAPAAAAPADVKKGLFSELSKGTTGLKHVDKSQMTHKNPELRASSVVAATAVTSVAVPKVEAAKEVVKPPVFALQGNKWVVEFQKGNKNIVIDETSIKQAVYIYKCTDSAIQVKGKVNSISLDSCVKTAIVFENIVGSIEVVNCKSVQIQATGKVPTVSLDKTDGAQVYLSKESLDANIVSAKSSEMNVLVPTADGSDYVEHPLPEQYKTVWDGKKFVTTINDIAG